ncbi:MAG: hypothetical protein ACREOD_02630, partial [Candidatus Dormibacteria bacterium]
MNVQAQARGEPPVRSAEREGAAITEVEVNPAASVSSTPEHVGKVAPLFELEPTLGACQRSLRPAQPLLLDASADQDPERSLELFQPAAEAGYDVISLGQVEVEDV